MICHANPFCHLACRPGWGILGGSLFNVPMRHKRVQAAHKLPVVFVVCPYDEEKFGFSSFKKELESLPWTCIYANTSIQTKHLLENIRRLVVETDFSLFDVSGWNANVALELGLAHGLNRKPYYILSNATLSKDVPSDIKGLQRIEYAHLSDGSRSLRRQLIDYFFLSNYHPTRMLWNELSDVDKASSKYVFALQVLAHLRDHARISMSTCDRIAGTLALSLEDWNEVCDDMGDLALLIEMKNSQGFRLKKPLYKRPHG